MNVRYWTPPRLQRDAALAEKRKITWLGVSVDGAFGILSAQFALTYAAVRLVLVLLYIRTWKQVPGATPLTRRYVTAHSVGIVVRIISASSLHRVTTYCGR